MPRDLAVAVAGAPRAKVTGAFLRHQSTRVRELQGSDAGGRWGPPGLYPVLYLGRPQHSVVIEAYRHLIDPFVDEGMRADLIQPRLLLTCDVQVDNLLDLRDPSACKAVALGPDDLTSPVGDYDRCRAVGRVAHQLELHGIIAPAATGMGETLALFERHLPQAQLPRVATKEVWGALPPDPRQLRIA